MKIVVGITGASGSIYALRLIEKLNTISNVEFAVVVTDSGKQVIEYELGNSLSSLSFKSYSCNDFNAPFASGSASYSAMIVLPCSMGTLGRIAAGTSGNLLERAADVMLKERRKLILAVRETPLSLIHLKNMLSVTEAGGIICPASPSFYSKPNSITDVVDTVVNRVLSLSGIITDGYKWGENA